MKKRCVIITGYHQYPVSESVLLTSDDYIVCADSGYLTAVREGIKPDLVIGDYDSYPRLRENPSAAVCRVLQVPAEKNETDTMICLQHALSEGYTDIFISGGLSGRLDHTIANLQLLLYAKRHGAVQVMIADKYNQVFLIEDTFLTLPKKEGFKLSLFSYSEVCEGVTISGVKYPLSNYTLTNHFPLGISNEFLEDAAYLGCRKGLLLVMLSCDAPT